MKFHGAGIESQKDIDRLANQMDRIYAYMRDGKWRTLQDIADATYSPHSSVSAQLRNLRKHENGGYLVERQRATDSGLCVYRIAGKNPDSRPKKQAIWVARTKSVLLNCAHLLKGHSIVDRIYECIGEIDGKNGNFRR